MSKVDLEAVIARRAAVANELKALEKMRAEMEAEDQDLIVAERVLRRLADGGKTPMAAEASA
jgi:chaperonin cofactor prefoldin